MKKVILKNEGGGYRVIKVIGDNKKEAWKKIEGEFIYDFQFHSVKKDILNDRFKVEIIK